VVSPNGREWIVSDLLTDLLENAPQGVRVVDLGTNDRGERVIQWWACARFGISLRVEFGCEWAEGMQMARDTSRTGFCVFAPARYLEGFGQVIEYLREVIGEYRPAIQF
jgi:hypothetical protein